jgi:broad specificity phosphatase PhoE
VKAADDLARELSEKGVTQCIAARESWFRELGPVGAVAVCSVAGRCQDTARHLFNGHIPPLEIVAVETIYAWPEEGNAMFDMAPYESLQVQYMST